MAEALDYFKQASRSDPDDSAILFNLGITLFLKEDIQSALEMLLKCIQGFPSLEEAARTLGFSSEETTVSLTGKSRISKEEIDRLLREVLAKIPKEEEAKERAKKIFTIIAGTRGTDISKKTGLSWMLYWKE
jgi:tetratricopeptide (TPR) repeat protein